MRPKLSVFAAIIALALVGLLVSAAAAAGAVTDGSPINSSGCVPSGGNTFCFRNKGELHAVETPSGNVIVQQNVTIRTTLTDSTGQLVSQDSITVHDQSVVRPGADQEVHSSYREVLTTGGQTCTYTNCFHVVNGHVQFDRTDVSCI
jgi:hypothetical protein